MSGPKLLSKKDETALQNKIRDAVGQTEPTGKVLARVFRPEGELIKKGKSELAIMKEIPVTQDFKPACGPEVRMASVLKVEHNGKHHTVTIGNDGKVNKGDNEESAYFVVRKDQVGTYFAQIPVGSVGQSTMMTNVFEKKGSSNVLTPVPMGPIRMQVSS